MISVQHAALLRVRAAAKLAFGLGLGVMALGASHASAAIITDSAFFNDLPSTLIAFDTNGSGGAVTLIQGQSLSMPSNEYASKGVTFSPSVNWVNDGNASFDAVENLLGLGEIAIPGALVSTFTLNFSVPVRAFGFWTINNIQASATAPTFTARDSQGGIIETVSLTGSAIDATLGVAAYGFLGILSSQDIASVVVTKQAAILDNLTFSAVPAPGAGLGMLIGGGLLARGRKRSAA